MKNLIYSANRCSDFEPFRIKAKQIEQQIENGHLHACEKCATSKEKRFKVYRHAFMMCPMRNVNWIKFLRASTQLRKEEEQQQQQKKKSGGDDNSCYDSDFDYILASDDDDDDDDYDYDML